MIEERWGESAPWSLGVEEELVLVDPRTFAPAPVVGRVLAAAEGRGLPGRLKTELFASFLELNTPVCADAHEAARSVAALRRGAAELAAGAGAALLATGAHPLARPDELEILDEPRYRTLLEDAGPTARRQFVAGLHVHVGMASGEACLHALEGALPWLPVVLALSANSPYLGGAETGFASNRALALAELPRSGAPPPFARWDDWRSHVGRLVALGLPDDYTALWWDARPHPRFGTLELRIADQPTSAARTAALVALLQALAVTALDAPRTEPPPGARSVYAQNRWAAARFGPRAELLDEALTRRVPASELARELLERVAPAAERLGTAALLGGLDPDRCEADEQLALGRERGLDELCAELVRRSLASAA